MGQCHTSKLGQPRGHSWANIGPTLLCYLGSVETSLKDATHQLRTGGKVVYKGYNVEDDTKIHDISHLFLSSTTTKDNLVSYLANLLEINASIPVVMMTRSAELTSQLHDIISDNSSHEGAYTKMMFMASLIARSELTVQIYSPETYVFVLALSMLHILGPARIIIVGFGERKRNIKL